MKTVHVLVLLLNSKNRLWHCPCPGIASLGSSQGLVEAFPREPDLPGGVQREQKRWTPRRKNFSLYFFLRWECKMGVGMLYFYSSVIFFFKMRLSGENREEKTLRKRKRWESSLRKNVSWEKLQYYSKEVGKKKTLSYIFLRVTSGFSALEENIRRRRQGRAACRGSVGVWDLRPDTNCILLLWSFLLFLLLSVVLGLCSCVCQVPKLASSPPPQGTGCLPDLLCPWGGSSGGV